MGRRLGIQKLVGRPWTMYILTCPLFFESSLPSVLLGAFSGCAVRAGHRSFVMPERGRSPPYPYDPNEHTPPAWDQTVQHRDVSPEISVSNPSTPLQSQSPPQYPGPREGSPWATKEHPTVTVQSCEDPFRLSRWQRIRYWANQTWAYEIAACCISAITLAGVIILLATRQNKPLPEWPALITLNSLIAVLTTIMKGCMIFAVAEGHYVCLSAGTPADRRQASHNRSGLGFLNLVSYRTWPLSTLRVVDHGVRCYSSAAEDSSMSACNSMKRMLADPIDQYHCNSRSGDHCHRPGH